MNKCNLEILREFQREYNPKTAFGNPILLKLISQFKRPGKDGYYEVSGDREVVVRVSYRCPDCGRYDELDDIDEDDCSIEENCTCGAKNRIMF